MSILSLLSIDSADDLTTIFVPFAPGRLDRRTIFFGDFKRFPFLTGLWGDWVNVPGMCGSVTFRSESRDFDTSSSTSCSRSSRVGLLSNNSHFTLQFTVSRRMCNPQARTLLNNCNFRRCRIFCRTRSMSSLSIYCKMQNEKFSHGHVCNAKFRFFNSETSIDITYFKHVIARWQTIHVLRMNTNFHFQFFFSLFLRRAENEMYTNECYVCGSLPIDDQFDDTDHEIFMTNNDTIVCCCT